IYICRNFTGFNGGLNQPGRGKPGVAIELHQQFMEQGFLTNGVKPQGIDGFNIVLFTGNNFLYDINAGENKISPGFVFGKKAKLFRPNLTMKLFEANKKTIL